MNVNEYTFPFVLARIICLRSGSFCLIEFSLLSLLSFCTVVRQHYHCEYITCILSSLLQVTDKPDDTISFCHAGVQSNNARGVVQSCYLKAGHRKWAILPHRGPAEGLKHTTSINYCINCGAYDGWSVTVGSVCSNVQW